MIYVLARRLMARASSFQVTTPPQGAIMNTSHNPPSHHHDLVIENLAELAAAGMPSVCGACISDYFARESSATLA